MCCSTYANFLLGPELVIVDRVKKITQKLASAADDDQEEQEAEGPSDEEIKNEVSMCFNSDIVCL